jgi:hypothetical protein
MKCFDSLIRRLNLMFLHFSIYKIIGIYIEIDKEIKIYNYTYLIGFFRIRFPLPSSSGTSGIIG